MWLFISGMLTFFGGLLGLWAILRTCGHAPAKIHYEQLTFAFRLKDYGGNGPRRN